MFLFPKTGFGRFLLLVIIISTISYLVLNLVSFGGTPWITTDTEKIHFGLWTVCDISTNSSCSQWSESVYSSNITRTAFSGGKPSYIETSQPLEIISLIFYVFAAALIFIGILNLDGLPYHFMFFGAAALLFIAIVFISATLGVMSVQGRENRQLAYLDWAWWNGMVGLIMTIICFFALIALVIDMKFSPINRQIPKFSSKSKKKSLFAAPQVAPMPMPMSMPMPMPMPMAAPPMVESNIFVTRPMDYENYQGYNNQNLNTYFPTPENNFPFVDNNLNGYLSNAPLTYGNQYPWDAYSNNQSPSPIISDLAREYVLRASDAQYERDLLGISGQSFQQPYYTNTYL